MNISRTTLAFLFVLTVSQLSASDSSVGYSHMQNGKFKQAYQEYRNLAERGYPIYMNVIADMHQKGQGVPKSNMMAHIWYSLSAAQGNDEGINGKSELKKQLNEQQLSDSLYIAKEYAKDYLEPYAVSWSLDTN